VAEVVSEDLPATSDRDSDGEATSAVVAADGTSGDLDGDQPLVADERDAGSDTETDETTSPEPAGDVQSPDETLTQRVETLRGELDERLADLQRVTAEYANYRKRVDRDRTLVAEQATGAVLTALLPILDDLDRAREHGDLVGPFGSVAERLTAALAKFGLTAFGAKGDPFDPNRHEAVAHLTSPDVTEPSCFDVMRRGYLLGDRLLRAAMVAVADPE
jgi:molecular chaperone GrpE